MNKIDKYEAVKNIIQYDDVSGEILVTDPKAKVLPSIQYDGTPRVCINGNNFQEHNLISYILFGIINSRVEHIDLNRSNNMLSNLRFTNSDKTFEEMLNEKGEKEFERFATEDLIRQLAELKERVDILENNFKAIMAMGR